MQTARRSVSKSVSVALGLQRPETERVVHVNDAAKNVEGVFANNYVRTTRYTLLTFLPKNLFEQLRRLANVYFLFIALLQVFTNLSPTGQYTTIAPLTLILGVSAVKEAIEDFARYKSDVETNNRPVLVLQRPQPSAHHPDHHPAAQTPAQAAAHGDDGDDGDDGDVWETRPWKDVLVGDVVKIENGQLFPCDIVMLCSSQPQGMAYVETSNLDGETNLKIKMACPETNEPLTDGMPRNDMGVATVSGPPLEALQALPGVVHTEPPNNRLHTFSGYVMVGDTTVPVNTSQLLLRGTQLKQTRWVVGCVVFAGTETKIVMNSAASPSKMSSIERLTNRFIVVILLLMATICTGAATAVVVWGDDKMADSWYLPDSMGSITFVAMWVTYLILLATMVPISLYVTLEMVKLLQAMFINWDLKMSEPRDEGMYVTDGRVFAKARTSTLNEELGQIEYVFTDKTGTLTENKMVFKKCCVGGVAYGHSQADGEQFSEEGFNDPLLLKHLVQGGGEASPSSSSPSSPPHAHLVRVFLSTLALCHTVVIEDENGEMRYQSASPDEGALVAAARALGFTYSARTPHTTTITIAHPLCGRGKGLANPWAHSDGDDDNGDQGQGEDAEKGDGAEVYRVLNVLEFNADRKRMSVVVRDPSGRVWLLCKGADAMVLPRLAPNQHHLAETMEHLDNFGKEGLRTLLCAMRPLSEDEWRAWNVRYEQAAAALEGREQKLGEVAEEVEKGMTLVGATAIEDKLQQGVPDTLTSLSRAGIKVWMLTGDKRETAINIGHMCALLRRDMTVLVLDEHNSSRAKRALEEQWKRFLDLTPTAQAHVGLVVDGFTLQHVMTDGYLRLLFLELGRRCRSVVCCRVSPGQKAEVVRLVKDNLQCVCLSIGDGANDVAMIQTAHVGVGVLGREGTQAVLASDYSIAQFRFLRRLLLVHGHWNHRRIARVIGFNFYKNFVLYLTQLWFAMFNMASGQSLYESWTQSAFNVFFASLPIIAYGVMDQDVGEGKEGREAEKVYVAGPSCRLFNARVFGAWVLNSFSHSLVCFLVPLFVTMAVVAPSGHDRGLYTLGMFVYTAVVYTCCGKVLIMARSHNKLTTLAVVLTVLSWFLWLLVYSFVIIEADQLTIWMLGYAVLRLPAWWLVSLLAPAIALFRDFLWRGYKDSFQPGTVVMAIYETQVEERNRSTVSAAGTAPPKSSSLTRPLMGGGSQAGESELSPMSSQLREDEDSS